MLVVSFTALAALWKQPVLGSARDHRAPPSGCQGSCLHEDSESPCRRSRRGCWRSSSPRRWWARPTPTGTSHRRGSTSSSGSGYRYSRSCSATSGGRFSPWRAIADACVWARERTGGEARSLAVYPERLGRWPAAAALFAFATLELAYHDPASPRALALAIALYSSWTLLGMAAFGRESWTQNGEGFSVLFGFFARMSPLRARDGRLFLGLPLARLSAADRAPGTVAFVAVMLGSVAFDGFSRTISWQNLVVRVQAPSIPDRAGLGKLLATGLNLLGLTLACLLVAGAYIGACSLARSSVNAPRSLLADFVLSLVPIAFAYEVAHYVSLFVAQGQLALPLLSDPFAKGWDLIGLADYTPNLAPLSLHTIWCVQAAALVAGHVAGLTVAHDRAVTIFKRREDALRSQYPMLGLMVLYTVAGLWLLSRR